MSDTVVQNALSFNTEITHHLKKACAPLEKYFGITLIAYRRFYFSGKLLHLFNHSDWMRCSFKNHYWNSTSFYERMKYLSHKNTLYYLWPEKPPKNDKVYCGLYDHDIWNGVIVYKKFADCLETYSFASLEKKDTEVKNIYLFEKNILERFILYFKDQILPLVVPIENQILLPYQLDLSLSPFKEEQLKCFFDETNIQNFYIRTHAMDVKLTKRQEDCLSLFTQCKKMKEIGKILNLSEKTVEFYLRKVMEKTQCKTKSQLILSYKENREKII